MGLAACPRASFAAGGFGAGVEGSASCLVPRLCLERCGWGVGIGRIGPIERNVSLSFARACSRSGESKRASLSSRSIAAFDKNSEKWAYVLQAEMAYGLKAYSLEGTGHHGLASPSLLTLDRLKARLSSVLA